MKNSSTEKEEKKLELSQINLVLNLYNKYPKLIKV
jgi:hypothetical protein